MNDLFRLFLWFIHLLSIFAPSILGILGFFYWLWMAIKIGSFWMFVVGISPLAFMTVPVGAWSFFFGMPDWVGNMFG